MPSAKLVVSTGSLTWRQKYGQKRAAQTYDWLINKVAPTSSTLQLYIQQCFGLVELTGLGFINNGTPKSQVMLARGRPKSHVVEQTLTGPELFETNATMHVMTNIQSPNVSGPMDLEQMKRHTLETDEGFVTFNTSIT